MNPSAASAATRLVQSLPWLGLVSVAALCWVFLLLTGRSVGGAGALAGLMGNMMRPDDLLPYLATTAWMWVVMMVAMMVPAVLPMARAVARVQRDGQAPHPLLFALGYLGAWTGFAFGAAALQWSLHQSGWLGGEALALSPALAGGVLVAAGVYQLSAFKEACLRHCRSPLGFVLAYWRTGPRGALAMGVRHGAYCVGCCWLLMLLMFAGGAMSVLWMGAISVFILAERVLPDGPWVSKLPGVALASVGGLFWLSA